MKCKEQHQLRYYQRSNMSAEEKEEMLLQVSLGNQVYIEKYIQLNMRTVRYYALKYKELGVDYDDLIQEGSLLLVEYANNFTKRHCNYLPRMIDRHLSAVVKRQLEYETMRDCTDLVSEKDYVNPVKQFELEELRLVLDNVLLTLPDHEADAIRKIYLDGLSFQEVAQLYGRCKYHEEYKLDENGKRVREKGRFVKVKVSECIALNHNTVRLWVSHGFKKLADRPRGMRLLHFCSVATAQRMAELYFPKRPYTVYGDSPYCKVKGFSKNRLRELEEEWSKEELERLRPLRNKWLKDNRPLS